MTGLADVGGIGGTTSSGTASSGTNGGGNAHSGNSGNARGGSVFNSGATINNAGAAASTSLPSPTALAFLICSLSAFCRHWWRWWNIHIW